ncbi:MAG: PilN domain-containing protein [Deltaproteobacteria bacterium]|nr:PilN domain-containing protein [Deltaproteobacteria bacterium]
MQKIDINLAGRKDREGSSLLLVSLALLAFSVLYTAHTFQSYRMNRLEIARSVERLSRAEAGAGAKQGESDPKLIKRDVEFINSFVSRKAFSWTGLLSGLEESVPDGVQILQISPDFRNSRINITGAAKGMKGVLAMVDSMGSSGHFKEVFLLKHEEGKPSGAGMVIFNIHASYGAGKAP